MKLFSSLRLRILLLLLAIVLPVYFILFYSAYEQRQAAVNEVKQDAAIQAKILSGLLTRKIEGARSLLISLSYSPTILNRDSASCSKLLADILRHNPQYTNLGAADPDGNVFCSAVPMKKAVNASDMAWFQRTVKSNDIAFGDYQIGRIIGKPVIIAGYAARDESGRVRAAIFVPFDISAFSGIAEQVNLPQSTVFIVLDRNGTILSLHPEHSKWVGKTSEESRLVKTILTDKEGLIDTEGFDGIKRIYAFTSVADTDNSIFVSIGIKKDILFADINRQFTRNLILFSLFAIISFAAAMIISKLARQAEHKLAQSEEKYRTITENSRDMIYRMSLPDGRYEYVSLASKSLTGYSPDEFYDSPILIQKIIHPDWHGYFKEQWENLISGNMPPFYEYQIIHKSGDVKWLHQRNALIKNNEGHPVAIEGVVTDITERKKAEDEIRTLNLELEERVRQRTIELEEKIAEIEKMNKLFVGRELRMIELKERIKELERK